MIKLSASLIRDYMDCPQRAMYRIENPEQSVSTIPMEAGSVVHKIIEEDLAFYEPLLEQFEDKERKKIYRCISNYERLFKNLTSKNDKIEYHFNYNLYKDVFMSGKIDRIIANDTVLDWKSSYQTPESIDDDVQFIIYYDTYKRLFGREPKALLYIGLYTGKVVTYHPKEKYIYELYNRVIPEMVKSIKHRHFMRQGIFKGICESCSFKDYCLREM